MHISEKMRTFAAIKEFTMEDNFAIQLFANDRLTLNELNESHLILRMPIKGLWKAKPITFQADPFLFVKGNELFLFYELQYGFAPAKIVMIKTNDLIKWTEPIVVLEEPFHLSFPFVFEDEGKVYMIPESEKTDKVRLYVANDSLTSFSFVRTLIEQNRRTDVSCNFADSHILKYNGVYYLFTSYQKAWQQHQEVYLTDDLLKGTFIRHPQSPIVVDNEYGRNGGSIINFDGELLRVSQDCHKEYGENVSLHQIVKLDDKNYEEQLYRRNIFSGNSLFPDGGHQLNIIQFQDKYIFATDYKENRWTWYHLYHSFLEKMHLAKKR